MKNLCEVFSGLDGSLVEVRLISPSADGSVPTEAGRVVYAGTDYVALESVPGDEPLFIPYSAIRSARKRES